MNELTLDHGRYLADRPYRRQVNAQLRNLAGGEPVVNRLLVVHEDDGACCRSEPWPVTLTRVMEALHLDGVNALGVRL